MRNALASACPPSRRPDREKRKRTAALLKSGASDAMGSFSQFGPSPFPAARYPKPRGQLRWAAAPWRCVNASCFRLEAATTQLPGACSGGQLRASTTSHVLKVRKTREAEKQSGLARIPADQQGATRLAKIWAEEPSSVWRSVATPRPHRAPCPR